ncbi:MAG: N-acetylmuramidase family protein [Rhodocyclaceae bacterium]|nr:N-acetylmuramidase family protein [Rhodocyclaceae bacterium]
MRKDDTGAEVRRLQDLLAAAGFDVEKDGWYGPKTEQAVREFQQRRGLVADGIAGPKTLAVLGGAAPDPKHLTQADIERAAQALDVSPAAIIAVNEVEAQGNGFDSSGRPLILFERHVMYKRLAAAGEDADALAAKFPELVNPKRGGYRGGAQEWFRLELARQIHRDIANESASWGKFQIMGYQWHTCGYGSIEAFVGAMGECEYKHLAAFVDFVQADPALHKALKARKWADFARLYNGPAYKENLYDSKLASAYARHAGPEVA